MQCFGDDLVTQQLLDFGAHTRPELAFAASVVRAGDCVYDLGAHIGTFAIPLAQRVGATGRVVAVEADKGNFSLLRENVATNNLGGIVQTIEAVLAPAGMRYRATHERRNTGATRFVEPKPWERMRRKRGLGIDDIAVATSTPDFIKIDIEGLELAVLKASLTVRRIRPVIYAEVSSPHLARYGGTVEELDEFLHELGYRLFKNIGERNAAHDEFDVAELQTLGEGGPFFDVLAVPSSSDRVPLP